jgi:protein involved in polysaccharide export with SLBB domain
MYKFWNSLISRTGKFDARVALLAVLSSGLCMHRALGQYPAADPDSQASPAESRLSSQPACYAAGAGQISGQALASDSAQGQDQYAGVQANMSAAQIISILRQAPDTLSAAKDVAGRQYGVDPSIISDAGVYNCIQQDPQFRSQVVTKLIEQGYAANPQPPARGVTSRGPRPTEQPSEIHQLTADPYPGLPSTHDLYSQDLLTNARPRRFGSDAFLFGIGNADQLPMDLPVGPDYVLGPGDNLVVNMWGGQSARLSRSVDRQGQIDLPEAGAVTVSGLTIAQAQDAAQKALGTQFQDEHVELSLGRVRTVRVYVVGDVQRPGAYDVSSLSTTLNALYAAGGPTSRGSLRVLKQYRGKQLVQEIDLYDFLLRGIHSDLERLLPGDTILVPTVGPEVTVTGMVRRPAIYELKGKEDLKDVLNLAGGVLVSADIKEIKVERVIAHERHTMLKEQISDGSSDAKVTSFEVQDGDQIQVSPILPYNDQVVYLEGHVFKPGRYAWRDGMSVNDLLHSYQDVMPEPAVHAEIVRLVPPDLHPVTISFDLPEVLIGDDPITLQPFDTVRIFGRYQIDPPKVSIFGPVLRPGDYPMSQKMTVADLVRMAGGFRRSAYRKDADLSSYVVQNGQKVLLRHSVVAIGRALDGDESADVVLQPGDAVGIRQLTGWNDIGASITISGEVTFAGTYGVTDGERLSSVLKRAGGFRAEAYPQGAVLDRVQVREMEEVNRQEMIRRVETTIPNAQQGVNGTSQDQLSLLQSMQQQRQEVLAGLRNHPSSGRMVIKISANIDKWENTPADIVVRAGDHLTIPKIPNFVLVSGQVFDPTGISFRPGKDAGWYLRQAGGVTRSGDRKNVFILRADGSVVGDRRLTIFDQGILGTRMYPGDSIIVPEKVIGGSQVWRNLLGTARSCHRWP